MRRNATLKGRCVREKKRKEKRKGKEKKMKNEKETKEKRRKPYHVEYAEVITECD